MAGRIEYVIAHPNGEETVREAKGGKAPKYATWALMNGEWTRVGWSYTGTLSESRCSSSRRTQVRIPDHRHLGTPHPLSTTGAPVRGPSSVSLKRAGS